MSKGNRLVSLLALATSGVLIAAWGAIYLWIQARRDRKLKELQDNGAITEEDASEMSSKTWTWILGISQIVIGLVLIVWGLFQYFSTVESAVETGKKAVDAATKRLSTLRSQYGNPKSRTTY